MVMVRILTICLHGYLDILAKFWPSAVVVNPPPPAHFNDVPGAVDLYDQNLDHHI